MTHAALHSAFYPSKPIQILLPHGGVIWATARDCSRLIGLIIAVSGRLVCEAFFLQRWGYGFECV